MLSPQAAANANKPALPALPPPAAPRAGAGPSFAQMLTVQAPPPAAPQPATAPKPSAAAAPHEAPPQEAAPPPAKAAAPATPARPATGSGTARPTAQADAPADTKPAEADGKTTTDAPDKPATDGLDEFTSLIGRAAPAAAPVDAAAAAAAAQAALQAAAKAPAADAGASADTGAGATGDARASRRVGDAGRALQADAAEARSGAPAAGHDAGSGHTVDAAKESAKAPLEAAQPGAHRPGTPDPALPGFAAGLQAATAGPAPAGATAAATTSAGIASPPQSAAFAPEVATRVSLMAVDGVQHAELQLNPADMGPVAVQIVVDGALAQVSFHAAHAETRQALEQSLPDLAAALQGQGLTLSGGGVFQQARQDPRGGGNDTGAADRGNNGAAGSRAAGSNGIDTPAARRTVGLLDTFA
jgi:flagellar hook-length control protein FliK